MGKFTGKIVFITGSSKGIGKATAAELIRCGATVVLNGRNKDALSRAAEELEQISMNSGRMTGKSVGKGIPGGSGSTAAAGGRLAAENTEQLAESAEQVTENTEQVTESTEQAAESTEQVAGDSDLSEPFSRIMQIAADVSEPGAFEQAVQAILQRYGRLDILILNAGLSSYGTVEKTSDATLHNIMKANAFGPFSGARIALPHIRKTGGSIVFISSLAGLHGIPHSSVYCMSKMALTALAQSLKTELTGQGIHIGIIYVGFTQNDPEKTAVGPDGRIRPIQSRPGWVQQSPQKVARLILRNISCRRFRSTLSTMGKIMAFFSRYFPRLFQFSMRGMLKQAEKLTAD